jgi:predicted RNA-binding protein with RPS1 domain
MSTEHLPGQGLTPVVENTPVQDVAPPAPCSNGEAASSPPAEHATCPAAACLPVPADAPPEATTPRVRLNPTPDPALFKAVPSLNPGEGSRVDTDALMEEQVAREKKAKSEAPAPRVEPVEIPRTEALEGNLEAELSAAMQSGEVASGIAAVAPVPHAGLDSAEVGLQQGTKVSGIIQSLNGDDVFIDLKQRIPGVVSSRQFSPKRPPVVGEPIYVIVAKFDDAAGLITCNLPRSTNKISGDWDALQVGMDVECMVTKTNKGGLDVTVSSIRGFMPASQADMGFVANLESFIGQKFRVRITEVNPARRRLVVSRRALLAEERESIREELMKSLQVGQTLTGRVKTLKEFGAFIDLGGMDGFLHVGQISWVRIKHPNEVLTEGQSVEVKVLTIDPETGKISLGMRQLSGNPWMNAEAKYAKGTNVTGKVTRIEPFGAFIELEPGIEGLIHISELDHKRVRRVEDILNVGQTVEVQILEVEPSRKRVSLSAKALKVNPDAVVAEPETAPGAELFQRKRRGDLKGGTGKPGQPGMFGNPGDFR